MGISNFMVFIITKTGACIIGQHYMYYIKCTGFPLFSKYKIPGFLKVFGPKFQVFCAKFQVLSYKCLL